MRITLKMLENKIDYLNQITGSPSTAYTRQGNGNLKANVGHWHLDGAYGGWQVARMYNEGGAITTRDCGGFGTKREVYDKLCAFIDGHEFEGKQ